MDNNIELIRGDSLNIIRQLYDKNDNPLVLDSTKDKLTFTMRKYVNTDVVIQKSLDDVTQDENTYTITLEPKDTQNLDFGEYGYDIEVMIGTDSPYVKTVEHGTINLLEYDFTQHGE